MAPDNHANAHLGRVTTNTSECVENACPCASPPVVAAIGDFIQKRTGAAPSSQKRIIQSAKAVLNCGTEACIITHPKFQSFVVQRGDVDAIRSDLARRFKPVGPRDSVQLLNNFDIDGVLRQWALVFPRFFNYHFAMSDFDKTGDDLGAINPVHILQGRAPQATPTDTVCRECNTFACVVNTDTSLGRGKHWVAIFGDCRDARGDWSVEFFNSAGNPPPHSVANWLGTTSGALAAYRIRHGHRGGVDVSAASNIRHQRSKTECGVYALYFIRQRLDGVPVSAFCGAPISDDAMTEFRKHLFRSAAP